MRKEKDMTILYVDDEPINLMLFQKLFSKKYIIYTASNAMEGLGILSEIPNIDITISDMKMPEMNGLEFITKARKEFSCKYYYILTGFGITEEIKNALQSGLIDCYFQKPFNLVEINAQIQKNLG